MSVEKTVAAGEVPATIRFYYPTDYIFNSLNLRTTYRAKMVKNQAGESQLDDVAISQDEKDIVNEMCKQAVYDIFSELFKITEGVVDPIFFNISINTVAAPTVPVVASGGSIVNYDAYPMSILENIDMKIENCIRYYILSEWYVMCALVDDAKLNTARYQKYLTEFKNLTFSLRKRLKV